MSLVGTFTVDRTLLAIFSEDLKLVTSNQQGRLFVSVLTKLDRSRLRMICQNEVSDWFVCESFLFQLSDLSFKTFMSWKTCTRSPLDLLIDHFPPSSASTSRRKVLPVITREKFINSPINLQFRQLSASTNFFSRVSSLFIPHWIFFCFLLEFIISLKTTENERPGFSFQKNPSDVSNENMSDFFSRTLGENQWNRSSSLDEWWTKELFNGKGKPLCIVSKGKRLL